MVEADFQREYRLDLAQAVSEGISWRRFLILLGGLSADSAYVSVRTREGEVVQGDAATERAVERELG